MNYTIPDNRPFITKGAIKTKVKLSEECKAMNDFLDSHYFSVALDAQTNTPIVKVTQKSNDK